MTAKEIQGIKTVMDSFVTNDLSSHLAEAVQNHFTASPITKEIEEYLVKNPISTIPPPHAILVG